MFLNFFSGLDTFKYIKHNHLPAEELQIQHNYNPNFWTKAKILLCKSYFSLSQITIAAHTKHILCKVSPNSWKLHTSCLRLWVRTCFPYCGLRGEASQLPYRSELPRPAGRDGERSPGCVHTPSSPWNSSCPSFLPDVKHLESAHIFGLTAEWAVCLDRGSSLLLQIRYYFSDRFQLFTTQGSDLPCPGPQSSSF